VQCAQSRAGYFAGRVNNAIRGAGTKDQNLIRIIVSRCDVDLGNIKREYEKKFGKSLAADVSVYFYLYLLYIKKIIIYQLFFFPGRYVW